MIIEYQRPKTIEDAIRLLSRKTPRTIPLAGGSSINKPSKEKVAVVDLQALELNQLSIQSNRIELGAMLTLQDLLDEISSHDNSKVMVSEGLIKAIHHEASQNLRNIATIAGTLVAADGRSPLTTALLALNASLSMMPKEEIRLGDLLPQREQALSGKLITMIRIPSNSRLAYEYVARSKADLPIVCAAVGYWPKGRIRVALGGYGVRPVLVVDGKNGNGVEQAAKSAYSNAGDIWASSEYRSEMAGILTSRCFNQLIS